jgi:hypothetical protein
MADLKSTTILFTINGINSVLAWNVIVSSLDYLTERFKVYNVNSLIPIPLFIGKLFVGIFYHSINQRLSYSTLIKYGNNIVTASLIGLFAVSALLPNSFLGFLLLLFFSFLNGIGANLSFLSFYAMLNFLT